MNGKFGLLGKSLNHSISPLLHSYLGDYSYDFIERDEEGARNLWINREYTGFNVTIPYKKLACSLCSELSAEAWRIGSVNTVIFTEDKRSIGYNTDAFGFDYLLNRNKIDAKGKDCLILGTGGASLAAEYILGLHNAKSITFLTRNKEGKTGSSLVEYKELYDRAKSGPIGDYGIIINTTPVGMYTEDGSLCGAPIDLGIFKNVETVIDVIYNPVKTSLCKQAESLGIKWVSGLQMLIAQGYKASELFKEAANGLHN